MEPEDGLAQRSHVPLATSLASQQHIASSNMARELLTALKRHSQRTLLVDASSGRQWTGSKMLDHCCRIATGFVRQVGLKPNQTVMTICDHSDLEIVMALAVLVAGGALFGTTPSDGLAEVEILCGIVKPDVFVVSPRYHGRAVELRKRVPGLQEAKIVLLNDGDEKVYEMYENGNGHGNIELLLRETTNGSENDPPNGTHQESAAIKHKNGVECNGHDEYTKSCSSEERDGLSFIKSFIEEEASDLKLLEKISNELIEPKKHVLTYMLTSGSTGRPKVVPSTHEELVWGLYSMVAACQNQFVPSESCDAETQKGLVDCNGNLIENGESQSRGPLMPCTQGDVVAGDLPLDHGAGFNTMLLTFWLGAKFIVMPSYDVDAFWQAVNDHKISFSISSTTFTYRLFARLKVLIDSGEAQRRWTLDSFRYICCCGAKLAFVDLVREVQATYKHLRVVQAYGCTEIGFISMVHLDDNETHLNSTGYLFPGLRAKVLRRNETDEVGTKQQQAMNDDLCRPNERGELLVWARSKFKGYLCQPNTCDDPKSIYADCHDAQGLFYKTGDQAHFDAQGRLYIHGRFKDTLCLMEDWKILPAELEELVDEHPLVEMSVVVGTPDPQLPGCHAPRAFVRLYPANSPEARQLIKSRPKLGARFLANDLAFVAQDIYQFVAERTAKPKHLKGGVRVLEDFPRVGVLNKVDRKALKLMT